MPGFRRSANSQEQLKSPQWTDAYRQALQEQIDGEAVELHSEVIRRKIKTIESLDPI
ncbi:MAG: hypothetical protein ACJAUP_000629 [Cellvibrionaceae bacterium]|jgi:hypothetical protein